MIAASRRVLVLTYCEGVPLSAFEAAAAAAAKADAANEAEDALEVRRRGQLCLALSLSLTQPWPQP